MPLVVTVHWTDWIDLADLSQRVLGERLAVYMYATASEALYIGMAGDECVRDRHNDHVSKDLPADLDALLDGERWRFKVGRPHAPERLTIELLEDVEKLLIFRERTDYGRCRANIGNTQDRGQYFREDMLVVSAGQYLPLAERYRDLTPAERR